ncbi:TPA: DUF1385 domain-containing protein [candidate division WOR-3 bacterium]|nr:DUF1385 domain-containing protein [candidate division WOR-3 bacterium]
MENKKRKAGGQALIEGVLMMADNGYALSVRKQDGTIVTESKPFTKLVKRNKKLNFFPLRGIITFIETLKIGFESLNRSADIYYETDTNNKNGLKNFFETVITFILAIIIGLALFLFLPIQIVQFLKIENQFQFNLLIGLIRFIFFIVYLLIISQIKDIKRIFMYHGAEHKTVFAYENGDDLTVENTKKYSTKHPRCGTSFLFITLAFAIIFYSLVDTVVFSVFKITNTPMNRFLNHIIFLPIVATISYELLFLSEKFSKNIFIKFLIYPGLLFQYITTKEPTDDMLEVSIASLKESLKFNSEDGNA